MAFLPFTWVPDTVVRRTRVRENVGIGGRGRGGDCNMVDATEVEQGKGKGEGTREDSCLLCLTPYATSPLRLKGTGPGSLQMW